MTKDEALRSYGNVGEFKVRAVHPLGTFVFSFRTRKIAEHFRRSRMVTYPNTKFSHVGV